MTSVSTLRSAGSFRRCLTTLGGRPPLPLVALLALFVSASGRLAGQEVLDRSLSLRLISSPDKGDSRSSLDQFGMRPTLVVVPCQNHPGSDVLERQLQALSQVDRLASKWRRAGGEVVCLDPLLKIEKSDGRRESARVLERARMKHTLCATLEDDTLRFVIESDIRDRLFRQPFVDAPEFRWVFLGEPGTVTSRGQDVFGEEVRSLLKTISAPALSIDRGTARCFEAINEWRLADAQKSIAKVRSKEAEQAERLEQMLESTVARYRRVHVEPLAERGLLTELAVVLDHLVEVSGKRTDLGGALRGELENLRSSDRYAAASQQRIIRDTTMKLLDEVEDAVDAAYTKAMNGRGGYDQAVYSKQVATLYPATIERVADYVRQHSESPYRREVALFLMEFREELQYARSVLRGGGE